MALTGTLDRMVEAPSTPQSLVLAELVRAETNRRGWTITRLLDQTDVSRNAMYRMLRGETNVGGRVLRPIERELGLPTMLLSYVRDADIERIKTLEGLRPDLLAHLLRELAPTDGKKPGGRRRTDANRAAG